MSKKKNRKKKEGKILGYTEMEKEPFRIMLLVDDDSIERDYKETLIDLGYKEKWETDNTSIRLLPHRFWPSQQKENLQDVHEPPADLAGDSRKYDAPSVIQMSKQELEESLESSVRKLKGWKHRKLRNQLRETNRKYISEMFSKEFEVKPKEYISFDLLLYLAAFTFPREQRDGMLGDIEEKFVLNSKRFGKTRAKKIIAWDIFVSVLPVVREVFRSRTVEILKAVGLYQIFRHLIG